MKKLIINLSVGVVLFGGSLVGGLAATGRLNHDGVANIPLLNSLFPAPPEDAGGEAGAQQSGVADAHAAPAGEVQNADSTGDAGVSDASLGGDENDPQSQRRTKTGRSVESPAASPEGGGGHGEAPAGGHGEEASAPGADTQAPVAAAGTGAAAGQETKGKDQRDVERDFAARELALAQERTNKYAPGGYFTFPGMPAGLTPEQLNEAWERVQAVEAQIGQRKTALDLRAKELEELADDIGRRQRELGKMQEEVDNSHRLLDERIARFQEQVKLVRNDEVAALRRNAQTYESFDPSKSAELITELWGTEEGQAEVLKTFESWTRTGSTRSSTSSPTPSSRTC